jgi:CheY-like chemotaxis protein
VQADISIKVRIDTDRRRAGGLPCRRQAKGWNMKILVADDDPDTVMSFSMYLQLHGHDVRGAVDGQEAVDIATAFCPDAVLLDIDMPNLSGFDAAKRIRALLPDVLLMAITGWTNLGGEKTFRAAGFDRHMLKPVSLLYVDELLNLGRNASSDLRPQGSSGKSDS